MRASDAEHRRRPTRRQGTPGALGVPLENGAPASGSRWLPLVAILIAATAIVLMAYACTSSAGRTSDQEAEPAATHSENDPDRVTFVAVGDNLPEVAISEQADAAAGEAGDGRYDFRPLFAPIRPYVAQADLAYMNQETHLGGDDIGPQGYPSFNVPDAMADAVVDAGFDFVASASNHSYDWGLYGALDHSCDVWSKQPVAFTGTARSQEEADTLAIVERDGIRFALLDYTYGLNGFERSDVPPYAVNFIDEDRIRTDVARAKKQADVVMVAMHWGTENQTEPDADQLKYAQLLADLDVDVILGSHPHVIGPLTWIANSNGSGHRTLCAYSLGNFTSHHDAPHMINDLGGMLTCDFVKADDGSIGIENVSWTPLVMHEQEGAFAVYALKDYTPVLASAHNVLSEEEDPIGWMKQTSADVVNSLGDNFPINA